MQWLVKANMDSCRENLLTYDKDTSPLNEGKAVSFFLKKYFSKGFEIISHNIFMGKVFST